MSGPAPITRTLVRRDTYRDSVELMRIAALLEGRPGVARAALLMGTPANRALLAEAGFPETGAAARASDLVIAVAGSAGGAVDAALAEADRLLASPPVAPMAPGAEPAPRSLAEAAARPPGAALAIISTPGP